MNNLGSISKDLQALELGGDVSTKNLGSVSFEIPVSEESSKNIKRPPKRILAAQKSFQRVSLTVENLNKKQQQAEERRKRRKAEKLACIHQRQEAAREMAKNVEILLQQRALCQGNANNLFNAGVQKMSSEEIMNTARQVELNFYHMKQEIRDDLNVEKFLRRTNVAKSVKENQRSDENQQLKQEEITGTSMQNSKPKGGVSFTVDLDDDETKRKMAKRKQFTKPVKKDISHDDLHYKQMKAEERRMRRLQLRSERVRANRDTYYQLHSNLAQLAHYQDVSSREDVDPAEVKAANREAARLANEIADTFDKLAERYKTDLERTDGFHA